MPETITVDDITVRYRHAGLALREVSFAAAQPITFVVGQNGAGKTTLFRALLGSVRLTSGRIVGIEPGEVGYCPQEFALPPKVTVRKYLGYIGWLKELPKRDIAAEVARVLDNVGLANRADSTISDLSGGMRRRVGLAHALLGRPPVVLLDEPLVGVDPVVRKELRELLARLSTSTRFIVSTHLVDDITTIGVPCDVVVLARGRVIFAGPPEDLPEPAGVGVGADPRLAREAAIISLMGGEQADVVA